SKPPATNPPAPPVPPVYSDINDLVTYRLDSGSLRLKVVLLSSMERGAFYRLTIRKGLADLSGGTNPGLKIGQITLPGGGPSAMLQNDIAVEFQVREVPDPLTAFNIRQDNGTPKGAVRD